MGSQSDFLSKYVTSYLICNHTKKESLYKWNTLRIRTKVRLQPNQWGG